MIKYLLQVIFAFTLLCAPYHYAQGQGLGKQNATSSPATLDRYNQLISHYRYENPDSALLFAHEGLMYAQTHHDKAGEAMILNQLGMINDNQGKVEESLVDYLKALNIYRLLGQHKGMATETIRLGVVEMRKGNYDKATNYFFDALKLSESIHDTKGIMEANITLGEAQMGQHNYGQAINYLTIGESLNDQLPLSNLSLNLYNDFGVAYTALGQLTKAKSYLTKGISKSNLPQYQGLNITLTNNLATVYAKEGNIDYCIQLQKTALNKAQNIHNFLRELQTLSGLANTYKTINVDTSLNYLLKARALAESKQARKQVTEALEGIAAIYKQKGDYKAALETKSEQYALADKYFYKEMAKQVASLQVKYELSKSKAKIRELSFANQQQETERRTILGAAAFAIILMLVAAWFYYRTRNLNKLLTKVNHKLNESNHIKDKLFSILGHDLRTPFISVINLLSFIDDEDLPAASRKELIADLGLTTQASLETLDSLLKWGEMQIKGIRLTQTEFPVNPVTKRILTLLHEAASYKSIEVANTIGEEVNVYADVYHLEFVLRNLVANAIKFTGTGGRITLSAQTSLADRSVNISIEDNGVGIPPDKLKHIFNLSNVSSNGTYNEKGTSLGLLICKEFIHANQGQIHVESEVGKGSVFTITLPMMPNALLYKRNKFRLKLFKQAAYLKSML